MILMNDITFVIVLNKIPKAMFQKMHDGENFGTNNCENSKINRKKAFLKHIKLQLLAIFQIEQFSSVSVHL